MLRQPSFWQAAPNHPLALILSPLSCLWRAATALRCHFAKPYTSHLPVICIGNISVGGSGKTPTALAIAAMLKDKRVCFLTRGYGGNTRTATLIDNATDAALYGDEAILLSRAAPTIVARNRVDGLRLAEDKKFEVVIVDDGFQNPSFTKTLSILVIDGARGLGNGRILPAGPLRETIKDAGARADAVVVIGHDAHSVGARLGLPTLCGDFIPAQPVPSKDMSYVAFAGIGQPEKFFTTLSDQGFMVVDTVAFPDHYPFTDGDMERLGRLATRHNARLITTQKDHVRLPVALQSSVATLPVTLTIEGDMTALLAKAFA